MLWMPRTRIKSERMVMIAPDTDVEMPKLVWMAEAMEFACVMLPMPKDENTANSAKSVAMMLPSAPPIPFFIAYIGPPAISPTLFVSRYLTASTDSPYFVESPKRALTHIQTRAPGPPSTIAVATPTILPVPTVAESAVISDWNGEMSPSCFSFFWKIMPTA